MARAKQTKIYRTFVKGLITEASPLTYPADASIDEDNCILYRKGNRSRRLGFDYESGYTFSFYGGSASDFATFAQTTYRWEAPDNDADKNLLVHQFGSTLFFYAMEEDSISTETKAFSVDLTEFRVPNTDGLETAEVSMAGGKGYLFVVGAKIEPFFIEYDSGADTITTEQIHIRIRDLMGVDDDLANDEEPVTLSNEHKYNLMNQGWIDAANTGSADDGQTYSIIGRLINRPVGTTGVITDYFTQHSRYPGNNKVWWTARDATTSDFDPALLAKFFSGAGRVARGHFILNAFYKDRSAVSAIPDLEVESVTERPPTVAFYSGRVWYALNSDVYYSQVLDNKGKAGACFQEADPTSEDISDLIATDGGVIPIPAMSKAVKLVPIGNGIVVFGNNGIWYITGTDAGFSALDISVSKINPIGTESANSIVEAEGQLLWWSKIGIMAMSQKQGMFGTVDGVFDRTNISETTIQSFYNHDIPEFGKKNARGIYDPATNTVQWLFTTEDTTNRYLFNRVLNLDLTLQAFYPWTIETPGPYITGFFATPRINELEDTEAIRSTFIRYICGVPSDSSYNFTFGYFNNPNFVDWEGYDSVGSTFMSFVETGYELLEDVMRQKQAPYIYCYFRRTEENYVESGDDYTTDKQSSCKFQVKWDWSSSQISNRWSTKVEAYRHTRLPFFSEDDLTFDTGYPIVVSRNKVRGHGRSIQFRFESDARGKDFDLLGWATTFHGNTEI